MIETGIARQLDAVGRITLPKELRKSLGFKDRELLEIYTEDDKIILRKCERQKQDIFTGSEEDLIEYKGKLVSKETPVDILVTPGITITSGVLASQFVGPGVSAFMTAFGNLVKTATVMQPLFMGIALTLPISSAAICIMLSLDGLAGGAATAGCCA